MSNLSDPSGDLSRLKPSRQRPKCLTVSHNKVTYRTITPELRIVNTASPMELSLVFHYSPGSASFRSLLRKQLSYIHQILVTVR